ncbi:MAG TPA: cobalamin-independent methionine synthase II family protein [Burkholderiales bacterium]|nr:cobalamin-independent methionine synthase II family protein [Burkholderiales bacterium]
MLRPRDLVSAREDAAAGRISQARFNAIEDRAVEDAIRLQERAGLPVITDGEQRRLSFQSRFAESVSGLGNWDLNAFLWGRWYGDASTVGDRTIERPAGLGVVAKLRRTRYRNVEDFVFLRSRTTRTPKITLPSPSLWANFWSAQESRNAYPTLESFLADIVQILREEVAELVRNGATYIQLDAPHYALLLDPTTRPFYESLGWSAEEYLERGIEMDNAVMGDFPGVTFGFHLCRGNQASRWLASGGYERIARTVFRRVRAQRLLLEYDDARSGSFTPLGEVPGDKWIVLGLITTKRPDLEPIDVLEQRIHEASRFVPLERLAISPQCGFSSSVVGNTLSPTDQERKLRLVVETAQRVWGE